MEYADDNGQPLWRFASEDGSVITDAYPSYQVVMGVYVAGIKNDEGTEFDLYDAELQLCDQSEFSRENTAQGKELPAEEGWEYCGSGEIFAGTVDGRTTLWNRETGKQLELPDAAPHSITYLGMDGAEPVFEVALRDNQHGIIKGDLEFIFPNIQSRFMRWVTNAEGKGFLVLTSAYRDKGIETLIASDCKTIIAQWEGSAVYFSNMIMTYGEASCICMDYEGNIIFCCPNGGMSSGD